MYRIVIQPIAINLLREISDRRIRQKISDRIDKLKESSEMQGKPLLGELDGYYSVRAVGQRYRIIYAIEQAQVTVMIVACCRTKIPHHLRDRASSSHCDDCSFGNSERWQ